MPPFDNPKPTKLIERILEVAGTKKGDIVLDFFSGSCTTAQAVLEKNAAEQNAINYIMVQLPEPCDEQSDAFKSGYKNIANLGKERIRKAAEKVREESDLLSSTEKVDLGFRVFKLDQSNFNLWDGDAEKAEDLAKQLELHVDHIDQASSAEDILYELLLKAGFELTTKVEKNTMAGKDVYAVSDGAMLICLDKEITPELIDALADANPLQVICLDEGFKVNDQLKTNAVQTFKSRAKEDEEPIVFRTV
ncbi:MAG: DNA methyltransferase [Candidatus Dadabacteria bacterium]|nr:DNA methyltransferase [Candidatus Dadabacteria bacterium]